MARRRKKKRRRRRRSVRHGSLDTDDFQECFVLDREDIDHQGLAKSIDAEYALEEAKRNLSFWEVLKRERARKPEDISEKSRDMSPWARTKRRMTYAKGDVESKYVLMEDRSYGEITLLDQDHINDPPSLDDLNQKPVEFKNKLWSTGIYRISVVAISYFLLFPLLLNIFINFQTIDPDDFDIVVGQIAPSVGVLYATLLALTLQVLYGRFTRIQENATTEAMLLSQVTRNLLSLFVNEREWAVESCQMVANQVRIMLSRTRGVELLSIMKADTYSNLLSIIDDYHYLHGCDDDFSAQEESITNMLRGEIAQLMEARALRLSDEASSLPPTHFLLLTSLTVVSIVAYVTASLKVVEDLMHPPQEASLLFSGLVALYILFFNFCRDLNGPFNGVYQIKRSNAVSHLMQTKWLIVNQLGDSVSFKVNYDELQQPEVEEEKSLLDKVKGFFSGDTEDIVTVEAGAMQTLVNELEAAVETVGEEGDLCDAADTSTSSLDCTGEERLLQLQAELARLKLLNQQLVASSDSTPEMKSHQIGSHQLLSESYPNISVARSALEQASLETKAAEKALADAVAAEEHQSTSLIEAAATPLTDKATGVTFPKLENGLYLAGVGVRKKAFINVYSVAMYTTPQTLEAISSLSQGDDSKASLRNVFEDPSSTTSFVLQMTFKADADTIAGAIADSVRPRYSGPTEDVKQLETLISEGVKSKGGTATKGTIFRFDCSADGVSVSVDGSPQGVANYKGMGSAFVDVFTDEKAVSPQLIDSCLDTWCGSIHQERENAKERIATLTKQVDEARAKENDIEAKQKEEAAATDQALAETHLEQAEETFKAEQAKMAAEEEVRRAKEAEERAVEEAHQKNAAVEGKVMTLKEKATGVSFDSKLEDGLFLVGCGVRKKAIINVYAVACYSSPAALEALSPFPRGKQKQEAQTALLNAARTFDAASPKTSFVLEMTFKADAETIAGAIAEGVKPRYGGSAADVKELETLIIDGVKSKGGQATKGTVFRFDCTKEGVSVSVDGNEQGMARFEGMGSAFVDVFLDSKAVSPQLIDSCLNTWCGSKLF